MYATVKVHRNNVVVDYIKDKKYLRLPTGVTQVQPEHLEKNLLTSVVRDYKAKNKKISLKLLQVETIIDSYYMVHKELPSVLYIKEALSKPAIAKDKDGKKVEIRKEKTVQEIYQEFYKSKQEDAIVKASLKDYISTYNVLAAYQYVKGKVSINTVNSEEFLKKFERFCSEKFSDEVKETFDVRGSMNDNTISKRTSVIRTFMRFCTQKRYVEINNIDKYKSKIKKFQPTIVILKNEEILALEAKELTGENEKLRDILLFLCRTGIRYSDLLTLTKDDIINGSIVKDADKTRKKFKVPLHPKALLTLEKYNYDMNMFNTTMYNRLVKLMLEKVEVCNYIINTRDISYLAIDRQQVMKFKEICSHTGRRTFIANCVQKNISIPVIMSYTGHKKISSLQVYIDQFQIQQDSIDIINTMV